MSSLAGPAARRRGRLASGPGEGAPHGRRGVRHPQPPRGVLPRQRASTPSRTYRQPAGARATLPGPALGRRLPGHRRLGRLQERLRDAGPGRSRDIAARGLGYGIHLVITAVALHGGAGRAQGPAAEPPGAAARRRDGLRVRPQGRRERPGGRARPRSVAGEAALHGGAAADRRIAAPDGPRRTARPRWSQAVNAALAGRRPHPRCGCCRASCRPSSCRRAPSSRSAASRSASTRPPSSRCSSTSRPTRSSSSSARASPASRRCCG